MDGINFIVSDGLSVRAQELFVIVRLQTDSKDEYGLNGIKKGYRKYEENF